MQQFCSYSEGNWCSVNFRIGVGKLPELLQKIRKVKSSTSPPSSTSVVPKPTATTSSVVPKTPILPQRSPLTPVSPVSPEDNNAEEVLNFGTAQLVKKDVFRHVGSKSSHLVNYLLEEGFTDEELGTCSLKGAKGRCKDSTDVKPALDGDKLADIIAFTKSQWNVSEDEIKKIIRNKLNNCHKKARGLERPPSTT
ncbi:BEN domain-containing protein 6-like [Saccostrea cucullata]|uniref:BEN domain-containing protein 6-like n=1 Tax=Saccostrea cuccullata TaxID=36930 RepID=UPI002ED0B7F6